METYRVWKEQIVHESWCCDVEADSEDEAIAKYDSDEEIYQESSVMHTEIIEVEKLNNGNQ